MLGLLYLFKFKANQMNAFRRTAEPKYREVTIDTLIEDGSGYNHQVNLAYTRWENTNVIVDYKIIFQEERKFEGWTVLDEITREMICGLEGTNDLEFISTIVIE